MVRGGYSHREAAADGGKPEAAILLMEHGADPAKKDNNGNQENRSGVTKNGYRQ